MSNAWRMIWLVPLMLIWLGVLVKWDSSAKLKLKGWQLIGLWLGVPFLLFRLVDWFGVPQPGHPFERANYVLERGCLYRYGESSEWKEGKSTVTMKDRTPTYLEVKTQAGSQVRKGDILLEDDQVATLKLGGVEVRVNGVHAFKAPRVYEGLDES